MPLIATDLTVKTIDKLARVGVRTLHDVMDMPMADIARRFDVELVNYVGRLTGQFKHPVAFYHPPDPFNRYLELLFDVDNVQWLNKPLHKLLGQLEAFLKLRDKLAHELRLVLHQRDADTLEVTVSSAAGEYQAGKWLSLFSLRLNNVVMAAPIIGITLNAERIADRVEVKSDLFDGRRGSQSPQELVSILQAKLGSAAVKGLTLTDDPRPNKASQYGEPLTSTEPVPINRNIVRPSVLLPAPEPLNIKVSIMQGPERIVAGWWDSKPIHRDYFVARSREGQSLWVFRNHQHQWFIHGLFC